MFYGMKRQVLVRFRFVVEVDDDEDEDGIPDPAIWGKEAIAQAASGLFPSARLMPGGYVSIDLTPESKRVLRESKRAAQALGGSSRRSVK